MAPYQLSVVGSLDHKIFDVMGDTVNTTKRFCENAQGAEILFSFESISQSNGKVFSQVHEK